MCVCVCTNWLKPNDIMLLACNCHRWEISRALSWTCVFLCCWLGRMVEWRNRDRETREHFSMWCTNLVDTRYTKQVFVCACVFFFSSRTAIYIHVMPNRKRRYFNFFVSCSVYHVPVDQCVFCCHLHAPIKYCVCVYVCAVYLAIVEYAVMNSLTLTN